MRRHYQKVYFGRSTEKNVNVFVCVSAWKCTHTFHTLWYWLQYSSTNQHTLDVHTNTDTHTLSISIYSKWKFIVSFYSLVSVATNYKYASKTECKICRKSLRHHLTVQQFVFDLLTPCTQINISTGDKNPHSHSSEHHWASAQSKAKLILFKYEFFFVCESLVNLWFVWIRYFPAYCLRWFVILLLQTKA